jgi:predicted HTH transcriptional regulator
VICQMPKDLSEFKKLVEEKPAASKTSNAELIQFLSEALRTTKETATFLGVETGTAFSRLKRLMKAGKVTRRWEGNKSYWVARKAVGLPDLPEEEEGAEEEEVDV